MGEEISEYPPGRKKPPDSFNFSELFPDPRSDFLSGGFERQKKKKGLSGEFEPSLS